MTFPIVINGEGSLPDFIAAKKADLDAQLAHEGTVLMRGFDITTPEDFDAAVEAYGEDGFTYERSLSKRCADQSDATRLHRQ